MLKVILLILYLATILAVIFVERKNPTEALLWVLVMVCIPYAGVLLYLVFGSTTAIKLTSICRRRRLSRRLPAAEEPQEKTLPGWLAGRQLSEEDLQVLQFNANYNHSAVTCYEDYRLFITGEAHYRALFEDIKEAKECIYVLFYTIHHDVMGEALVKALTRKAEEGVTVLVMCDFIANLSTPRKMFRPLLDAGGKVIRVKPYLTHYRSHRKIVTIDHQIGYIGGMNIGRQYANLAEKKNPWRDTQIRLTGACAAALDAFFLTDFLCAVRRRMNIGRQYANLAEKKNPWRDTQIRLTGACAAALDAFFLTDFLCAVRRRDWEDMVKYMESIQLPPQQRTPNLCQFVVGGVDNDREAVKMNYLSMIRSARKKIRIQSPYFIPDASVLDALKTAAASGVEIELMIPGIKASFFLDPVTTYYAGQIMEFGARVYKYHGYIHAKTMTIDNELCCIGSVNMDMRSLMVDYYAGQIMEFGARVYKYHGYIHAKTMTIDNELCCIGSVNMDMRSLMVDDEICGIFYANDLVREYINIFEKDISNCDPYGYDQFLKRGEKEKLIECVFLPFAPLM